MNDPQAATGMIGINPSTKKAHIVRAILESLVFRVAQLLNCAKTETKFTFKSIR